MKYLSGAYWDFWDHFVPLTELSVSELLRLEGFIVDQCIPRFLPYSMSNGGRHPILVMVKLYLKLPIVWPLFGKQFLVVGRKKKTVVKVIRNFIPEMRCNETGLTALTNW